MSSYGGGNGYFYGNHFMDMHVNPPPMLNMVSLTNNPVIIKCERQENGSAIARTPPMMVTVARTPDQPKIKVEDAIKKEDTSEIKVEDTIKKEEEDIDAQGDAQQSELDIMVNNVVSSFNVRCHLNLRQIALKGCNVEYKREHGMVTMKLRRPNTTASIWSSGKITCTGATSNADSKRAARIIARKLQHLGFRVKFSNFRVVNVLCTCTMSFGINLIKFTQKHRTLTCYEPELHPGATYKIKELKATLKLFTTGSITVTAPSIQNADLAIKEIFPLVFEFKTKKAEPIKKQPRYPQPTYVYNPRFATTAKGHIDSSDEDSEDVDDEDSEASDSD